MSAYKTAEQIQTAIAVFDRMQREQAAEVIRAYRENGTLPFDPADFPGFAPEQVLRDWTVPVLA